MKIVAGGIPLGDDFYPGRQACVDQIGRSIAAKENLLILGPRRTGKTSSIQEFLRQESNPSKIKFIFVDLENTQNLYDFYLRLIKEIITAAQKYPSLITDLWTQVKALGNRLAKSLKVEMDLAPYLGSPSEVKLSIEWPAFDPKKIEELQAEFRTLLKSLQHPLLMVLDEFPELIWRFGQNQSGDAKKNEMIQKTQFLLSGLRMIRQEDFGLAAKHQIIIAGSINLDNTLKHLDLTASINDLARIEIPYLDEDHCANLMRQLVTTEKMTFGNETGFYLFIKKQFGNCSPFYIQSFANILRQRMLDKMGKSDFTEQEIVSAYKHLITQPRGPEYFVTRIERFYSDEKHMVYKALELIATHQFNNPAAIKESDLKEQLKVSTQREFTDLIAKMKADDMVQQVGSGDQIGFGSQFLCNFWNYRLVDGRFLK